MAASLANLTSNCPCSKIIHAKTAWLDCTSWCWYEAPVGRLIFCKQSNARVFFLLFGSVPSQSCLTLCDPMNRSMPGLPVHHKLSEFTQTHAHRVSDAIQPSHPLLPLLLLPPIPSSIRVFSSESTLCMRWPKYWSFSFSTSPSNEHPGLISFRMDWLDLLAVQGTLKSLLQQHSSELLYVLKENLCSL